MERSATLMKSSPPNIQSLYDNYIKERNTANREKRYKGKEDYYHASHSFYCRRMLYYESVLKSDITNPSDNKGFRKMRLGTVFHTEMEKCFDYYENNRILSINSTSNSTLSIPSSPFIVYQEKEIVIEDVNVRGHYDLVLQMETGEVYLYDYKTMGAFPWSMRFGRKAVPSRRSLKYEFQIGTYRYAVKKEFGRLDGMFLIYYNKDTSLMKQIPVDLHYTEKALQFWKEVNSEHKLGMPKLEAGLSPVDTWECSFCDYKDLCQRTA